MENILEDEPLLQAQTNKYTFFPVQDNKIYEFYQKAITSFWRAEELQISKDLNDWNTLKKDEQPLIKMILAFFSSSDGIVIENLGLRFSERWKCLKYVHFIVSKWRWSQYTVKHILY